jgi:NADPH:quinone reductase-like Zn-dependent oxidoreductase
VITTCSPRNFDYVKGLGASQAFDYRGDSVVGEIITALKGSKLAGAFAVAAGSAGPGASLDGLFRQRPPSLRLFRAFAGSGCRPPG